ncbi:helicase-associated domain-containing protein [Allonocardiopsis opalescens]|uniref:XPB/Ssl2-like helicase family protein n=1 Tax=Allonocardiopsis opalescens TaxID=1144618 RepID=A0A2T0Q9W9_9ACTN|nr:helicase-associated domain-containing protein [Allonocardiopsis opalescens]PRY00668.1 XPB/Ssl2-like helicase family protein [Allonocardiopsis opalescens]
MGAHDTYVSWLRAAPDDRLAALFDARPDLITPVPADLRSLAARATTRAALVRALDRLDLVALRVVEALVAVGAAAPEELPALLTPDGGTPPEPADTSRAAELLLTRALIWESATGLRPAPGLDAVLPSPAGLGPRASLVFAGYPTDQLVDLLIDIRAASDPAAGAHSAPADRDPTLSGADLAERVAGLLAEPARVAALAEEAGPEARAALDRLAWGPSKGSVASARRRVRRADASSPIDRLLARGLLAAVDESTVALPREVGLLLRGGALFRDSAAAPPLTGTERRPDLVDRAAGGQALTFLRTVQSLLDAIADEPPSVLRAGGLGTRELRRLAQALDLDETAAATALEAAHAAGLLAAHDGEWLPTVGYDLWCQAEPARRWARLATAWLESTRVASLTGRRDERGKPVNALGPGLDRGAAPEIRADVLAALAAAPGLAPERAALAARLAWERPRRQGAGYELVVDATLREAAELGLIGLGALAAHGPALPSGEEAAAEALAPHLPEPVDHVLLQADLTAVAPGPLVPELARRLAQLAEVESTGGATVYRFTPDSVRRALDHGQGTDQILALLETRSATPVPQPLRYLVEDTARRHGRLRVGTAGAYLRCDDPVTLDQVLADPRAGHLQLFRLAPTVVAGHTTRPILVEALRELGYAPVPEAADGTVVLSRPRLRRAEAQPAAAQPRTPDAALRRAAVRALRAGDEAATTERRPLAAPADAPPRSAVAATLATLSAAVNAGARVWIGYLDNDGQASSRIVEPARVEGGYLTAYDATRAAVHRFALHRITGVAEVAGSTPA